MIDAEDLSEDWIKAGSWDLPTDFDSFVVLAGGTKESVTEWISTHVAAIAMPHDLVQAVGDWLHGGSKGDVPGHEFHGNQYTGGLGGGETAASTTGGVDVKPSGSGSDGKQPSIAAAEARIAAAFPNATVNLHQEGSIQMGPSGAKTLADRCEKFAKEFPDAAKGVQGVYLSDGKKAFGAEGKTTFGWTRGNPSDPQRPTELHLNGYWFRGRHASGLDTAVQAAGQGDPPWRSTSTVAGTIDHELGHVLDFSTGKALSDAFPMQFAADVSGYAQQDPREAFAEAFAVRQQGGDLPASVANAVDNAIANYVGTKAAVRGRDWETISDVGSIPADVVQQLIDDGTMPDDEDDK